MITKKLFGILITAIVGMILTSCREEVDCCSPSGFRQSLEGSWLLVERGVGPGSGYYTTPVEENPPQMITFFNGGKVASNIKNLSKYKYYMILDDKKQGTEVVAFFRKPPMKEQSLEDLEHSYSIVWEENKVKLWFRFCVEGCHIGLRRLD